MRDLGPVSGVSRKSPVFEVLWVLCGKPNFLVWGQSSVLKMLCFAGDVPCRLNLPRGGGCREEDYGACVLLGGVAR